MKFYYTFLLLFTFLSCQRNEEYNILFDNLSDKDICIGIDYSYPVDSLNVISEIMDPINPCFEIPSRSQARLWQGIGKKLSWYYIYGLSESNYSGYVSFTIMDKDVRSCGDVESVQSDYNILARYDVTKSDIEALGWKLVYPPSPELRGMHLWINSSLQ